jgi:hypothetical protein
MDGAEPTATAAEGSSPRIDAGAARVGETDTIRYTLDVDTTGDLESLAVTVGSNGDVVGTTGFETVADDGRTTLEWDGESDHARVVIEADTDGASAGSAKYFDGGEWVLGRVPFVDVTLQEAAGESPSRGRPLGDAHGALSDAAAATYGDRYALVGDQETATRRAHGQRFRLHKPAGTEIRPAEDEIFAALAAASRDLEVGDRDDSVLLFALPAPADRGGESFPIRDEAWVAADEPLDDPNSVWLHEYVHTRQSFDLAEDMRWFREASAEYYAARLAYEQDRVSGSEMRSHLGGAPVEATLTDRSSWSDARVPYEKGSRVLAVLDRRIRAETDGERSLQDVFRRMNDHEGKVTYAEFQEMVTSVVGHSMDGWLDRYVDGSAPIASVYDRGPARSGLLTVLDGGFVAGNPALVFLVTSAVFSLVAAVPLYLLLTLLNRRWRETLPGSTDRPARAGR